jgi:serine/threonine protein kinase
MMDTVSHFTPNQDEDNAHDEETYIGEGGTSVCYKVRLNGKWFAKKRLKPELKDSQIYQSALRKEYELGARLNCPYLVHYADIGEDDSGLYVLTDYVDGIPLSKFIDENPDYFKSRRTRLQFIDELLTAVDCLHTHQMLHLDLNPSNILITHIGHHVKLIDYGFAYQDSYTDTTGGTPGYSAPEQFSHAYPVSAASDIYAIGCILKEYHLTNGHIAERCMKENPAERYPSATDLRQAIHSHKRVWLFAMVTATAILLALFSIYHLTRPTIVPAKYSTLRLPMAADSQMRVSTIVLDSTSQPPLIGGLIQNFDSTKVLNKGIIISPNADDLFITDSTKKTKIEEFDCTRVIISNTVSIEHDNRNEEEFIYPIKNLQGDQDYYVKAYVITPKRKMIYGKVEKIHTLDFSRFEGWTDVANVFQATDYTAFDLMTDEILDIDKDGCFYSANESPKVCLRNTETKRTGYYKFKTRWNYQLWYSHCGINRLEWKSYDTGVYRPVMRMIAGKLQIKPDWHNVKDTLNFYYTINGDWQRPEHFHLKYTKPITITHPCAIYCYARRKDGCLSYTNSYLVTATQIKAFYHHKNK